jgi:two-component system chemotaxis response regulator CheB
MPARDIIVVGASAGGVETLCRLLENIPANIPASIFVVVHLGTFSLLPEILSRCGPLDAAPGREGHFSRQERAYEEKQIKATWSSKPNFF